MSFWYDNWRKLGPLYKINHTDEVFPNIKLKKVGRKHFSKARIGNTWRSLCQTCDDTIQHATITSVVRIKPSAFKGMELATQLKFSE
ncbi:hypothetical protein H5410_028221 [Solanum commersonii]|uniref:Uncharacterized protein n=1 Tax=Solanum commersonii TaxID=4109 RepID=A0A9J5Z1G0_SOLCO|nr:hypothetical protein H5410_028221 [Solanum commersonii]